jgi:hypothetical protein
MSTPFPLREPIPRPQFDPQKRWYDEYLAMLHAANDALIEQTRLAQRVHALEQELQTARFETAHIDDLGSADLARIGQELRAKLDAITDELQRRHWPDTPLG